MLRAELEDSVEGLEALSGSLRERLKKEEITNYVFNENEALIYQEIFGLKTLLPVFDEINKDEYPDVQSLSGAVGELLKKKAEELEDGRGVLEIITRKIKKVLNYITEKPA
jgi:predicted nuclease with TOPRIM domain